MSHHPWRIAALPVLLLTFWAVNASEADIVFSDNFDSGASPMWGNEVGAWSAAGGVYNAASPGSFPNAYSSLPFDLGDFSIDVDINGVSDGGIWLRSAAAPGSPIGIQGVLLVTGAGATGGTGLYWHQVNNGTTYGAALNAVSGLFAAGSNPHIRVEVSGNTYSAFVNGSSTAATTLTTGLFTSGRVALYDFSSQTFDNVVINVVPEPLSITGCGLVAIGLCAFRVRRGNRR